MHNVAAFIETMVLGSAWGVSSAYSADDPEYGADDDDRKQDVRQSIHGFLLVEPY
jgi:hypothetical protein